MNARTPKQRQRRLARKALALTILGAKCSTCPATERLCVVHKDPDTFCFNPVQDCNRTLEAFRAEVAKCVLLCRSCLPKLNTLNRGFTLAAHGSNTMYRHHKCRCEPCRKAASAYKLAAIKRRHARGVPDNAQHGSAHVYGYYGCRCYPCRVAHSAACLTRRENLKGVVHA